MKLPKYFSINRKIQIKTYRLAGIFSGLEKIPCLKRLFGKNAGKIINNKNSPLTPIHGLKPVVFTVLAQKASF